MLLNCPAGSRTGRLGRLCRRGHRGLAAHRQHLQQPRAKEADHWRGRRRRRHSSREQTRLAATSEARGTPAEGNRRRKSRYALSIKVGRKNRKFCQRLSIRSETIFCGLLCIFAALHKILRNFPTVSVTSGACNTQEATENEFHKTRVREPP